MGRKKAGGGGEECGSWMDTYGDMVTLLLCFFVMLYSMSDLNQQKWQMFVKSIFPDSGDLEQVAINEKIGEGEFDVTGSLKTEQPTPEDLQELWLTLVTDLNEKNIADVSVSKGDGYTFVVFDNHTLFNGDSSVLTTEATELLDMFCEIIAPQAEQISQIAVMGHTAQGDPNRPNNPRTDRLLSAMRSAEVAAYIQTKDVIEPDKLVGISYGQFRPVASSETSEGRAKNRRVEFLIVDAGADIKTMNDFYDEYYKNVQDGNVTVTDGVPGSRAGFSIMEGGSMEGSASMTPGRGGEAAPQGDAGAADAAAPQGDAAGAAAPQGGAGQAPAE